MLCSVGWVQSLALAAVLIALILNVAWLVERYQSRKHDYRMKRLDQDHEISTEVTTDE